MNLGGAYVSKVYGVRGRETAGEESLCRCCSGGSDGVAVMWLWCGIGVECGCFADGECSVMVVQECVVPLWVCCCGCSVVLA